MIDKDSKIKDILKISGKIAKVFSAYDLDCPGCRGNEHDTVERVATNNGLDLKRFLSDLNGASGG